MVVSGICGCKGIDCTVFVVVRVVRGFYGGGGSRNRLICEICCKSCKRNLMGSEIDLYDLYLFEL